jgi:hypothetical protein
VLLAVDRGGDAVVAVEDLRAGPARSRQQERENR